MGSVLRSSLEFSESAPVKIIVVLTAVKLAGRAPRAVSVRAANDLARRG